MYDFACSGHVEKGEYVTPSVIREMKEETGVMPTQFEIWTAAAMVYFKEQK